MNKLLIQSLNNKFINNLALSQTDWCEKIVADIRGSLYRIYDQNKFTHMIFIDSLLDIEVIQFIEEFGKQTQIYIYKDADTENYKQIQNIAGILGDTKLDNTYYKMIKIPILVNHDLYHTNSILNKKYQIVSFLDKIITLPDNLQNYLYPKNNLPIKLFNNSNIIHPQNLGLLSEKDKALLLQNSQYYLALMEDYVAEAWACGCKVLTIDDLEHLEPTTHKNAKTFQSYSNFLKGLISAKK